MVRIEYERGFVLGLLNSKLLEWFIRQSATSMRGGYFSYESRFIKHLPICALGNQNKALHDKIVSLVQQILSLNKELGKAVIPQRRTLLKRQATAIDKQIDQAVYQLYGLTDEEIRIVEEETS